MRTMFAKKSEVLAFLKAAGITDKHNITQSTYEGRRSFSVEVPFRGNYQASFLIGRGAPTHFITKDEPGWALQADIDRMNHLSEVLHGTNASPSRAKQEVPA